VLGYDEDLCHGTGVLQEKVGGLSLRFISYLTICTDELWRYYAV